jgi:hypothetical protein
LLVTKAFISKKETPMAADIKTELQIPDLWYDFYARFLPGSVFVFLTRLFVLGTPYTSVPTVSELIVIAFASYLVGLLVQPSSSVVLKRVHKWAEKRNKVEEGFVSRIQHELGSESNESKILSKMHGEVAFFMQLTILGVLFIALMIGNSRPDWIYFAIHPFASTLCTLMVADRRVDRAKRDKLLLDQWKSEGSKKSASDTCECKIDGRVTLTHPNARYGPHI